MGQKFLSRMGLLRHARPVVERLARGCNQAVYIAVQRRKGVAFLDMIDTTQKVEWHIAPGGQTLPYSNNHHPGQVLLAFNKGQEKIVADLAIPAASSFKVIRGHGYAQDNDALGEGIASAGGYRCLAAAASCIRAICVISPEFHLSSRSDSETDPEIPY